MDGVSTNNEINIYGSPNLSLANLYGGFVYTESSNSTATLYDTDNNFSDNTLNIYNKNITTNNIYNFNTINFYMPSDIVNGDTMLTLTDTDGTNLDNVAINAGIIGDADISAGDTITLLTNSNGLSTNGTTYSGTLSQGISLDYDIDVFAQDTSSIIARINNVTSKNISDSTGGTLNKQTEGIVQTEVANVSTINIGSDRLIDWLPPDDFGFQDEFTTGTTDNDTRSDNKTETNSNSDSEESNDNSEDNSEDNTTVEDKHQVITTNGFEIFANMGGSSLKTKTGNGSYIKSKGGNYNLGFARSINTGSGRLTFAPLFEYLSSGIHGEGTSKYFAGGVIARMTNNSGFYYEGSVRVGRSDTDFVSNDFTVAGVPNSRVTYDADAPVLAGHVRLGHALRMDRNNLLDIYGIYFYTRQGSMSADLSSGEHYNFSAVDSSRFSSYL